MFGDKTDVQKFFTGFGTNGIRVSERPELFQTKIKIDVLQDCAKDLGTSKSRTKGAKRYR